MKIIFAILACLTVSSQAFAISCHGTEPFWGAEVSKQQVVVEMPGDQGPQTIPVNAIGAAAGFTSDYVQVYKNDNGPAAVVIGNKCTDGMSDFTFPQEVIIFTGTTTLYGCCGEGKME